MKYNVEHLEGSMAKITVTVDAKQYDLALDKSYNKNKSKFNVPGFRKGKATRMMVEKYYGMGALLEDAIDFMIDDTYKDVIKESGLDVVSRPEINIEEVEKGKDFVYSALVAKKPEFDLANYKGIEIEKTKVEVTDEDFEKELEREREKNSRLELVEDEIKDKDHTVIDFDGSIDGVPFAGGKGEDYPLVIGSNSFIKGFEEAIIGHKVGDEFDIDVTFPEEYHAKDLANKPAVFKVKIKEVKRKELPTLDDDFASEVSEFETLAEYKEDLRKKLVEKRENEARVKDEDRVVKEAVKLLDFELPKPMVEFQIDKMLDEYSRRIQAQGIAFEKYLELTGLKVEALREQMKDTAIESIKTRLLFEKVAELEKIEVSEDDLNKEYEKIALQYKMEIEKIKEIFENGEKERMIADLKVEKAFKFLVDNANIK